METTITFLTIPVQLPPPESRAEFSDWADSYAESHGCIVEHFGDNRCFSSRICGIPVISLDCAVNYPSAMAGEAQLEWLDIKLTETDGDRFRIVISHFPLNNYVPSRTGSKQLSYVRDSMKQQRLLEKHKNILFFSGHTHFSLDLESPAVLHDEINQVVYLNTASVGNVIPNAKAVKCGEAENVSGSMGLCIEIFENEIVINGIDFQTGNTIPSCQFRFNI